MYLYYHISHIIISERNLINQPQLVQGNDNKIYIYTEQCISTPAATCISFK